MTQEPSLWKKYMENPLKADPGMNGYCGVHQCQNMPWRESPLCKPHAWDMWIQLNGELVYSEEEAEKAAWRHNQRDDEVNEIIQGAMPRQGPPKPRDTVPGVIYYLEIGEHIKVGFTTQFEQRMRTYPPFSKLMAKHPGTLQTERHVLAMFHKDIAFGQEWFYRSEELSQHISHVGTLYPKHNPSLVH